MIDEYYDIDFQQKHPTVKGYWVQADKFTEMYRKATALDNIRDEIDQKQYDFMSDGDYNEGIRFGLMLAYQIIDKYRAEKEHNYHLKKIRAEIDGIEINGQVDDHTMFIRSGEQVKQMALDIIDKYRAESEDV